MAAEVRPEFISGYAAICKGRAFDCRCVGFYYFYILFALLLMAMFFMDLYVLVNFLYYFAYDFLC